MSGKKSQSVTTKTGDKGATSLRQAVRVAKTESRPEALGAIDELNALLGLVRASASDSELEDTILTLQNHLFVAGAEVATPGEKDAKSRIAPAVIEYVEASQRQIETALDIPAKFVIYGGTQISAILDLARAVARRAERAVLRALGEKTGPPSNLPVYLNRLSDLLYMLARQADRKAGIKFEHPDYRQG